MDHFAGPLAFKATATATELEHKIMVEQKSKKGKGDAEHSRRDTQTGVRLAAKGAK